MAYTDTPVDLATFRAGWVLPATLQRAHYMQRFELTWRVRSLCGTVDGQVLENPVNSRAPGLWWAGSFPRCKLCKRLLDRGHTTLAA